MIQELDEFNFHPRITDTPGISLVFFSGPHCSSCHHLRALLDSEQLPFKQYYHQFSAFEIKADKASALVNEFKVFHLPSLFLYRDGQFHCQLHAAANTQKMIEAIDKALSNPPEEEP